MAFAARSSSFQSILDRKSGDIERPKAMPVGTYVCAVKGQPKFDKSSKKQTDYVEFTLQYLEPYTWEENGEIVQDVDQDALDAALTSGEQKKALTDMSIRATYYLTEASLYRLADFLNHCGAGEEDMTLSQRISETPGKQLLVTVSHRASDDGQAIFAQVKSTAPMPE